ncbi:TlpA family protein disulfide reductase [Pedobacter jamesrossensis]|uniref:TlpA family protein disulfide reductase n=1 Tax=Pedobacter jamesrossensis TaxID=1908238 RepID=A0ABV8NRG5_9SPHI
MKKYLILILIKSICLTVAFANNEINDASNLLKLSASRLNEIKTVSYIYKREINNYKNNYFDKTSANCFINFEKSNEANAFNFQFSNADGLTQIYNGTEYFTLDKKDKTMEVITNPSAKTFNSLSNCYNSIPVLRNMLGTLAIDDSVNKSKKDTVIEGKQYDVINLTLQNKALDYVKGYRTYSVNFNTLYKLILDSKTHLPYQIIETNSLDKDKYSTVTTFVNLQVNPSEPADLSWFYSTYLNVYHQKKKEKSLPQIITKQTLPNWNLPVLNSDKDTTLSKFDFNEKIVVMDFWIKNCGPCMESFPKLKALQNKYGKEKFQLLTLNSYDDKKDVEFFFKREKPAYLMLYKGQELAKKLGINSYPTVVIIDKDGQVLQLFNGFDFDAIDKVIATNLYRKK